MCAQIEIQESSHAKCTISGFFNANEIEQLECNQIQSFAYAYRALIIAQLIYLLIYEIMYGFTRRENEIHLRDAAIVFAELPLICFSHLIPIINRCDASLNDGNFQVRVRAIRFGRN